MQNSLLNSIWFRQDLVRLIQLLSIRVTHEFHLLPILRSSDLRPGTQLFPPLHVLRITPYLIYHEAENLCTKLARQFLALFRWGSEQVSEQSSLLERRKIEWCHSYPICLAKFTTTTSTITCAEIPLDTNANNNSSIIVANTIHVDVQLLKNK